MAPLPKPSPVASKEAANQGRAEPRMNPDKPPKATFWPMPLQPAQPYFGGVQHKRPEEVLRSDPQSRRNREDRQCPSGKMF
jgi:hypothetical protein